mmetsp:Transcript_14935/g.32811  ORF Transcript_14935/g.32811 Transcript_14935/m.32811 type:complete len:99 (+) Transcript_14935:57-353(+)
MKGKTTYEHLNTCPPPLRGPKIPMKELLLSAFLLTVGVVFLIVGTVVFWRTSSFSESMPFTLLGAITFIPGSYHSFIFLMIFKKVPGYSYDQVITYNS